MFLPIVMTILSLFVIVMLFHDLTAEQSGEEPIVSAFTLRVVLILVATLDVLENLVVLTTILP